ncbi:MAG: tetratricopeptide repeat protein [Pseudomonadota bacterium]
MAYDLEEQEQLASLKAFWNQFGNLLSWVAIAAMTAFAGYAWWNKHQHEQAEKASELYVTLQKEVTAKDNAKVQRIAGDMQANFGGFKLAGMAVGAASYAPMSALVAAKSAFDANDLKTAKAQLQWAIEHGNDEYKSVAKLRLAGVLLDEKAYDDGLKLLSGDFAPHFTSAVADRKGDLLVAQNKLPEARAAYQAALDATDKKDPARGLIEMKLESIGGSAKTPA